MGRFVKTWPLLDSWKREPSSIGENVKPGGDLGRVKNEKKFWV